MMSQVKRFWVALLIALPMSAQAWVTNLTGPTPASITVGSETDFTVNVSVTLTSLAWGSTRIYVDGADYLCLAQPNPGLNPQTSGSRDIVVPVQGILTSPGTYDIGVEDYQGVNCDETGVTTYDEVVVLEVLEAPPPLANVRVTKTYTDDSDEAVEVKLSCNGGDDLVQSFPLSPGDVVNFNVNNFTEGVTDCEVTETVEGGGYIPEYDNGDTVSEISCYFENITSEQYTCDITNSPAPAMLTVTKKWDVPDNDQGVVEPPYQVVLRCIYVEIEGGFNQPVTSVISWERNNTDEQEFEVNLVPTSQESYCALAEHTLNTQIEADSDCALFNPDSLPTAGDLDNLPKGYFRVLPGGDYECEITNSLFFEGIPTLNQYGLALLALLMLSLGYVSMRRIS